MESLVLCKEVVIRRGGAGGGGLRLLYRSPQSLRRLCAQSPPAAPACRKAPGRSERSWISSSWREAASQSGHGTGRLRCAGRDTGAPDTGKERKTRCYQCAHTTLQRSRAHVLGQEFWTLRTFFQFRLRRGDSVEESQWPRGFGGGPIPPAAATAGYSSLRHPRARRLTVWPLVVTKGSRLPTEARSSPPALSCRAALIYSIRWPRTGSGIGAAG